MFNVRPEALVPWLHVEPRPADEVPGFRMNPDGSVRDTQRGAASASFGFDPSASSSPLTRFLDAGGNIYPGAHQIGSPTDIAAPPRNPLQDALDEIERIYGGFAPRLSGPSGGAGTNMVPSAGSPRLSPYAAASQAPSVPITSLRQVESDAPTAAGPSAPIGDLGQLPPPRAPESPQAPVNQGIFQPWLRVKAQTPSSGTSAPLLTDKPVEVPRQGFDRVADAGIVPVANVEEEETGNEVLIAQQGDRPPQPARKKITGPEAAIDHYMSGSGETVEYPFEQIITKGVKPSDFPAIADILRRGQPGSYKVEGKMPFSSPNYNARYSVGNITLNVNGTLVLDEEGNYSFKGEMGAEPDKYRFYSSSHRDTAAEIATQIGRLLPGREFNVIISGQKPISTTGRYLPSATY